MAKERYLLPSKNYLLVQSVKNIQKMAMTVSMKIKYDSCRFFVITPRSSGNSIPIMHR